MVLVDKDTQHIFWPSLLWLQIGFRKPESIVRDLTTLEKKGIDVIKGNIGKIDTEAKIVHVNGREVVDDYLVVSLGARLAPENVPSLEEVGYN